VRFVEFVLDEEPFEEDFSFREKSPIFYLFAFKLSLAWVLF
jgi:hypothetical protein